MKKLILVLGFLLPLVAFADTPPPGTVKAKMFSGDGATAITATGTALNVNVTNSSGLTTVNQGSAGVQAWLASITSSALPANACQETGGHLASIDAKLANPMPVTGPLTDAQLRASAVPISGTITATNSANGNTAAAVPVQATQIGGSDGANLRAVKVSSSGVVSVDGSASTQPISAVSLPLPTGASTAAGLTTINTTLGSPFQAGGSIGNTSFGISGTLPAFAATPTFNLGTLNGAATSALQSTMITNLGSPFQAGGSIGNTSFGISGTLPAYAATPTFNLGTLNGAATDATVANVQGSVTGGTAGTKSALAGGQYNSSAPTLTTGQQAALQLDVNGNLKTSGTATVSGTVSANQSGTWNITNVSGTVSLPTGAATSALQTTGNSSLTTINTTLGSPMQNSGGSVTANIGTTNGLALDATVSGTQVAQGSTTSGQSGTLVQGAVTTAAPSYTTTKTSPLSLTTAGALRIDGSGATQPVSGTVTANAGTGNFTVIQGTGTNLHTVVDSGSISAAQSGTWTVQPGNTANTTAWKVDGSAVTQPVNLSQINGASTLVGNGTTGTGSQRVTIASDNTAFTVNAQAKTPTAVTVSQGAITVGTTATRLTVNGSAPASTRVLLQFQLLSSSTANCYVGSSGVTTTSTTRGIQAFAGQSFTYNNDAGDYYAICDAVSQTFLVMEQE